METRGGGGQGKEHERGGDRRREEAVECKIKEIEGRDKEEEDE